MNDYSTIMSNLHLRIMAREPKAWRHYAIKWYEVNR